MLVIESLVLQLCGLNPDFLPALPESSGTYKVNNRHALMAPL
jgi:hypothetical protein